MAGQLFGILGITGFLWLAGRTMVYSSATIAVAEWWSVWYVAAFPAAPAVMYHLSAEMLQITRKRIALIWFNWLFSTLLIALQLRFAALSDGVLMLNIGYVTQTSLVGKITLGWLYIIVLIALIENFHTWRNSPPNSLLRKRHGLMQTAILLIMATGSDCFASSGIDTYQPGWLIVSIALILLRHMMLHTGIVDLTPEFATGRVIDRLDNATLVIGRDGLIRMANPAAAKLTSVPPKALVGMPIVNALPNFISNGLLEKLRSTGHGYQQEVSSDLPGSGGQKELQLSIAPLLTDEADKNPGFVVSLNDISQLKLAERELRHLSQHDPLTGLANRRLFLTALERYFAHYLRNNDVTFTLVFIDLDKFKRINDAYGHQVGDQVLRAIAGRLKSAVRESDYCARLGGDEFAVLGTDARTSEDASALTRRLQASFAEPITVAGKQINLSASIGSAQPDYRKHRNYNQLVNSADQAMYNLKHAMEKSSGTAKSSLMKD